MAESLYSTVLTPEDEQAGFRRAFISNPDGHYHGRNSLIPAVVCPLSPGDQIVKLDGPITGVIYSHVQHGRYRMPKFLGGAGDKLQAEWLPVFNSAGPAPLAVRIAQTGREAEFGGRQEVIIAPASLALRCPKCSHGFELAVDHIAVDAKQSCPACKAEDDVAEFNAANL